MEKYIEKARVLMEALPYMQAFRGKIMVIKFGGSIMESETAMREVLQDVVFMKFIGIKPVLIHGGGPAISAGMKRRGLPPRFVNGLRVTDKETMDLVEDILAHKINAQIVSLLNDLQGEAVGLSGRDRQMIKVDRLMPEVNGVKTDIGYVGQVRYINADLLKELLDAGRIPVIAPVGVDDDAQCYNINGDLAAGEVASSLGAWKLVYMTDTPGILREQGDEQTLISTISRDQAEELITKGVISGGMIPKVQSCLAALQFGVNKGHIIDGRIRHSLLLEIFTPKGIGTEILKNG
ncbi:MAG TPA: acetylglutamate kinase [bacterium]|nr:acetylglutamate kinase [bacterium]HPR89788.1 acetylglutamate kinase [bacterium]